MKKQYNMIFLGKFHIKMSFDTIITLYKMVKDI